MKKLVLILVGLVMLIGVGATAANSQHVVFLPMIFDSSAEPTPTPKPTHTRTPRPTVNPTATPTKDLAEGANTCAYVWASGDDEGGGMVVFAQVPSVCSFIEEDSWHNDGKLLVVKANRIKTDTYGCMRDDFGPYLEWPPVDFPCPEDTTPPIVDPFDPYGSWGFLDVGHFEKNASIVCGYCDTCNTPTFTWNCEESID